MAQGKGELKAVSVAARLESEVWAKPRWLDHAQSPTGSSRWFGSAMRECVLVNRSQVAFRREGRLLRVLAAGWGDGADGVGGGAFPQANA